MPFDKKSIALKHDDTKTSIGYLAAIAICSLFVVGNYKGHSFNSVQGNEAFDVKHIHEITRYGHSARFPCN